MFYRSGKLTLVIASLAWFLVSFGGHASASPASGVNLTTSPITLSLNIQPGTTSTQTLSVKNNTSQATQITMSIKTFGAYGNSGQAAITDFPPGDPAASYIKLTPTTFVAQPGKWEYVKATISLPKVAALGYYYAVVFQPSLPTNNPIPGHAIIKGSNAILILANTGSSNEIKKLQVASFSVSHHLYEYLPASFTVTIHNPGNIYLAPVGDIYISRSSSGTNTIDSLPINPGAGNVLPGTSRIFTASWADGFPVFQTKYLKNGTPVVNKSGNPTEQLKWDFNDWNFAHANRFRIGEYYAKLALAYSNGNHEVLLSSTISFWVIPWKLIITLIIAVALIYVVIRLLLKRYKKRIIAKVQTQSKDQSKPKADQKDS